MMMRLLCYILVLMLSGLPQVVLAATYYVATTGTDGAAGTIGAPWRTIQYGVNQPAA
jgi:hypothetical protein